jgi:hypothetical protein
LAFFFTDGAPPSSAYASMFCFAILARGTSKSASSRGYTEVSISEDIWVQKIYELVIELLSCWNICIDA